MRLDKFLWSVRLFKTRSLSAERIKGERVHLNERIVKASTVVKAGDTIGLRVPPIWRRWRVLVLPTGRIGPKLVPEFLAELTSPEELQRLEQDRLARERSRDPGLGRPTKRDRRDFDRFTTG